MSTLNYTLFFLPEPEPFFSSLWNWKSHWSLMWSYYRHLARNHLLRTRDRKDFKLDRVPSIFRRFRVYDILYQCSGRPKLGVCAVFVFLKQCPHSCREPIFLFGKFILWFNVLRVYYGTAGSRCHVIWSLNKQCYRHTDGHKEYTVLQQYNEFLNQESWMVDR